MVRGSDMQLVVCGVCSGTAQSGCCQSEGWKWCTWIQSIALDPGAPLPYRRNNGMDMLPLILSGSISIPNNSPQQYSETGKRVGVAIDHAWRNQLQVSNTWSTLGVRVLLHVQYEGRRKILIHTSSMLGSTLRLVTHASAIGGLI